MGHDPIEDLRTEIAAGRVLAIVGAGVSIGATKGNPVASWTGLLLDGVERCVAVAQPLPDGWADRVRAEIGSGDMDDLLSAAEKISRRLGAPDGGEYRKWLRESVGSLQAADSTVLEALRDLRIPLATTNYDSLLEKGTGLPAVTWRDGARVERMIREDEKAILHLHGYWEEPESVILGIRSYEEVLGDAHAQNVLRTLRTVHTLLFVGCGEGLADPNFGALLRWTRKVFAESEYRHYRLCLEKEADDLRQEHPPEERIHVLPYGPRHENLAPFLRSLRSTATASKQDKPAEPAAPVAAVRLPPLPRCFGREDEVGMLVEAICSAPSLPVPVLGGPGAGKTTITQAALHNRRVIEKFENRRYFVRCEGAKSRDALVGEIGLSLALEPGPDLESRIFQALERGPALLVLDNTETPWDGDRLLTEELLGQLAGVPKLALVASIRGEQRPLGTPWREAIRVGPLDLPAAREAFLAVAGERYRNDPDLNGLLEDVDRWALAVTLLAYQAEGEPDLAGLRRRWTEERTKLLRREEGGQRLTDLEVSLELSIQGLRMTEPARRLLSLLGVLPDGIAREDLPALLPEGSDAAAATLRKVGLALSGGPRLQVLAPVREHARRQYPPQQEDFDRVVAFYVDLALLGEKIGREGGAAAVERLAPETGNLETMILTRLEQPDPEPAMKAGLYWGRFFLFTGLGSAGPLTRALDTARTAENYQQEAHCLKTFGDIALDRSNYDNAREHYEQALPLYRKVDDLLGEANCIQRLGDIALRRSDHGTARERYEQALPLYRKVGNLLGEANCIKSLGDIALHRSDHDNAREHYEQALPLYRKVDNLLGEANCIKSLGDIALHRSDHDNARELYEQALPLYRKVGSLRGEANCIKSLGDIALERSDHDNAREHYEQALSLYRKVGDLLGEANCTQSLGEIAFEKSDHDNARERYEQALPLYRKVGSLRGEANCIQSLGDIALEGSDHDNARERYEQALPLYRKAGDLLGEANCIQSLGDIAVKEGDQEDARHLFEESLAFYHRIPEPYSIGWSHVRLARLEVIPEEREEHVTAAREAWTSIKRPDLVEKLDREFGAKG